MKKILALVFCFLFTVSCSLFVLSGCGGDIVYDNPTETGDDLSMFFDTSLPAGTLQFTELVLNTENFSRIIPLGQINPPGHSFPTDHIYFVLSGLESAVYAPTGGNILYIGEPGDYGDRDIRVGVTSTMSYYLGHVLISDGLKVGDTVTAGAQIGLRGNTSCVDFGVINKDIDNGFLSTKYPAVTLYGDKPLSYYAEPLRTQLYALVKPPLPSDNPDYVYDGGVTDGEFALDQLGTILGNWLREGSVNAEGWYEWTDQLSFCYDVFYTDQIRIGIGTYSNPFALKSEDNPINPKDVNAASGAVAYYLYNANNTSMGVPTGERVGLMMVQMPASNSKFLTTQQALAVLLPPPPHIMCDELKTKNFIKIFYHVVVLELLCYNRKIIGVKQTMEEIIKRLDELDRYCADNSSEYNEIIYEIDNLVLSIAGKNSEIYKNFIFIDNRNIFKSEKMPYLLGIIRSLKNEIKINGIKKDLRDDVIDHLHELIVKSSLKKYSDGHYADSVESAIKEINDRLKKLYMKYKNEEKDGADLFALIFNNDETKSLLKVADMTTISGKDEQDGYRFLFMGIWKCIRNPAAHANTFLSKEQAYKRLIFASMLMEKIDEAIRYTGLSE